MSAIGARTDVVLEGVHHPLRDLACEIELAPGTGSERRRPHRRDVRYARAISGVARIVAIVTRADLATDGYGAHLCALLADGTVICSDDFAISPFTLGLSEGVVEIAVGVAHVCGIRPDDTVLCVQAGCTDCIAAITPPAGFKASAVR